MSKALKNTGRDIFFSISNWGNEQVPTWGASVGNSWRTTHDMYEYLQKGNTFFIMKGNFLKNLLWADKAGPGHWNDPDLLQIGKDVMTEDEELTHFSLWAFSKAPLLLNTDLNKIPKSSLDIIMNKELIAANQD